MELIDRKTALDLGLKQYFTGNECLKGHIAPRRVSCGSCIECRRLRTQRWRKEGKREDFNPKGKDLPSQEYLRECFDYIFATGQLVWLNRPLSHFTSEGYQKTFSTRFCGKIAGHYHSRNGYLEIRFNKDLYKGHRIIWKLLTGEDPGNMLDHIDGDVSNNRIENLRVTTAQDNARNAAKRPSRSATSQYKGVTRDNDKWLSGITINDRAVGLMKFDTEHEAAVYYDTLALKYFGEYAKLNFPEMACES